jgi:hypothetical protein
VERLEWVTARGVGRWYRDVAVVLATTRTTRWDATGGRAHTVTLYEVQVDDPAVGVRRFDSDAERAVFLSVSFTDLTMEPVHSPDRVEHAHVLAELIEVPLATLTFVADYLQLGFVDTQLNAYEWPRLRHAEQRLTRSDPGYLDLLVGLIGSPVTAIDEILDLGLVLVFGPTRLAIPLNPREVDGPEAAEYTSRDNKTWIWRPGDELIDWLPPP